MWQKDLSKNEHGDQKGPRVAQEHRRAVVRKAHRSRASQSTEGLLCHRCGCFSKSDDKPLWLGWDWSFRTSLLLAGSD